MSYFSRKVREQIKERREKERVFSEVCQRNAGDYMEALKLSFEDLKILFDIEEDASSPPSDTEEIEPDYKMDPMDPMWWSMQKIYVAGEAEGFLDIEVDGEKFCLTVRFSAVPEFPNHHLPLVIAVCKSNKELNKTLSGNSYCLNYVPEEWHEKIVNHLKKEKDDLGI